MIQQLLPRSGTPYHVHHDSTKVKGKVTPKQSGFDGLEVSILASGSRVRGFKPGRSRRIFLM
jgi:hypothetical protein